jgi:hypothetical protein
MGRIAPTPAPGSLPESNPSGLALNWQGSLIGV